MSRGDPTLVAARHYGPTKADFTHHVVIPLARRLRRRGAQDPRKIWVERHWLHGPFVGLALADPDRHLVRGAEAGLRDGLRDRPSTGGASTAELLVAAERAGRIEAVPGPYGPIQPDNTVDVSRPERSHLVRVWGRSAALPVRDHLLAEALDVIDLACARHAAHPEARVDTALTLMALHATTYGPGATGGAMSFLSHLEDFLHRSDSALRDRFDRVWDGRADEVTARVGKLLGGSAQTPLEACALSWSRTARQLASGAYARGDIPLLPPDSGKSGTELSAFHRHVAGRFDARAVADDFAPYRVATNVLYLVLVAGDVRPIERYLAAHLLSRAVTRLTGVDWVHAAQAYESKEHAS